jgi:hypothetical protein
MRGATDGLGTIDEAAARPPVHAIDAALKELTGRDAGPAAGASAEHVCQLVHVTGHVGGDVDDGVPGLGAGQGRVVAGVAVTKAVLDATGQQVRVGPTPMEHRDLVARIERARYGSSRLDFNSLPIGGHFQWRSVLAFRRAPDNTAGFRSDGPFRKASPPLRHSMATRHSDRCAVFLRGAHSRPA